MADRYSATDWELISGQPYPDFGAMFENMDNARIILANGAMIMSEEHRTLRDGLTRLIAENWGLWEPGAWRRTGDRGGFWGMFEADAKGMADKALKPIRLATEHLEDAQATIARFPATFEKHMAPYLTASRRERGAARAFGDENPGRGRSFRGEW